MHFWSLAGPLAKFQICDIAAFHLEAEGRSYVVETHLSAGTRIHHEHFPVRIFFREIMRVVHHPEDVGVAAEEDVRMDLMYELIGPVVVAGRVASDMNHQAVQVLEHEMLVEGNFQAYVLVVAVAVYAYDRLEFLHLLKSLDVAPVSAVEDNVHVFEKLFEFRSKVPVSV